MIAKPMLAETANDLEKIKFPVLCTPKLDGIRCLKVDGQVLSRKFIEIPNKHIQALMKTLPDGLDGELMIPDATFNQIQSGVMREEGEPNFEYWAFDYVNEEGLSHPYHKRMTNLGALALPTFCKKVLPIVANTLEELMAIESNWVNQGFEGVMIRTMESPYKEGRSTEREGYLLKIKRFEDSEAEVLDYEELMSNQNEAQKDAFGRTKRSSHKAGLVPADTLGAFLVRDIKSGVEFKVSTGMDAETRKELWVTRLSTVGRILKYKYQPAGAKDKPRFPVFLGFRDPRDMSEG